MNLTPDEQRLIDLYRKAKRRRLTLHVVCQETTAQFYLTQHVDKVTVGTAFLPETPRVASMKA